MSLIGMNINYFGCIPSISVMNLMSVDEILLSWKLQCRTLVAVTL